MIEEFKIQNFRCFKEIDVPLRRLTVLIGENDTGKTAFLDAIFYLNMQANIDFKTEAWRHRDDATIVLARSGSGESARTIVSSKRYTKSDKMLMTGYYHLPSTGPSMTCPGQSDSSGPPQLMPNGQGVPALVDYFLRRDRKRFDAFVGEACTRIPGLEDIQVATPEKGLRSLDLKIEDGLVIVADRSSVGVRVILFFMALAYHPSPPEIVLIEEPECGVHPKRLGDIVSLARGLTTFEHSGKPVQIVMSTHSPHLLDTVNLETDQVLIFKRDSDGNRTASPADSERISAFMDEFNLGEVWYNEGEDGLIPRTAEE